MYFSLEIFIVKVFNDEDSALLRKKEIGVITKRKTFELTFLLFDGFTIGGVSKRVVLAKNQAIVSASKTRQTPLRRCKHRTARQIYLVSTTPNAIA